MRKKLQFGEAALFSSKAEINVYLIFFSNRVVLKQEGPAERRNFFQKNVGFCHRGNHETCILFIVLKIQRKNSVFLKNSSNFYTINHRRQ